MERSTAPEASAPFESDGVDHLATLLNACRDAACLIDADGRLLALNASLARHLGGRVSDLVGHCLYDRLPAQEADRRRRWVEGVILSGRPLRIESGDGERLATFQLLPIIGRQGAVDKLAIYSRDVTQERRLRTRLEQSRASLSQAQRIASIGNWEWEISTNAVQCSDESYRIFGLPIMSGSIGFEFFLERVHPADRNLVVQAVRRTIKRLQPSQQEFRIVRCDGEVRFIHARAEPHSEEVGRAQRLIGTLHDFTDRKLIERALARRAKQQAAAARLGRNALEKLEPEYLMAQALELAAETLEAEQAFIWEIADAAPTLRLRCSVDAPAGLREFDRFQASPGSLARCALESAEPIVFYDLARDARFTNRRFLQRKGVASGVCAVIRGSDGPFGLLSALSSRKDSFSQDDANFLLSVANVLSAAVARWRIEERITASLGEKSMLLKEVHHRVKNNLQIVSSLLNMQAAECGNSELAAILQESRRRVRTMALIHQRLYLSEDLTRIDISSYLRELTSQIARSSAPPGISLSVEAEPVHLDIEKAIPCGLIANELISNAIQHAFPQEARGEVRIALKEAHKGRLRLSVSDDGAGLSSCQPQNGSGSLGLRLVSALVEQLRGEISARVEGGTHFQVDFDP